MTTLRGRNSIDDDEIIQAVAAWRDAGKNISAAARHLGIPRPTLQTRLAIARRRGLDAQSDAGPAPLQIAPAPDADEPIAELLARKKARLSRDRAHAAWANLIPVSVTEARPIGLCLVGDPHIDDDGCDIQQLEHDLSTVGRTPGFFGGHVGDLTNNWVGRLAKLYAHQSTTFRDSLRLTEWMLGLCDNLFLVGGNHDCHDQETEALTQRGWMRHDEILDSDLVLTLNAATAKAEWNPIMARIDKPYDGEMVRIESLSISALVTPGHRILHRGRRREPDGTYTFNPDLEYASAESVPARFAVPTSSVQESAGCGLSDDQIALAGWILTDGSITRKGQHVKVTIWQSKDATEIRRLLSACGLKYSERVRERHITEVAGRALVRPPLPERSFNLSAESSRRVVEWVPEKGALPEWVEQTSEAQFNVFLDALIQGDGVWDGKDPSAKTVAALHKDKAFLERVQHIAVRRGWTARLSVARGKDWRLNLCKRKELQLERSRAVSRERYRGRVWCLTVPNGNFMVRRNGAAHFSGNCWNQGMDLLRFIARQPGTLQPHGARLALRWPDGKELRIHCRHDFPGKSQFSDTHGMKRELLWGHRDHILVAGHLHVDEARIEPSLEGEAHWMFRVSGYKVHDEYAAANHLRPKRLAPSVSLVLDPSQAVPAERVKPFWSVEAAADYLTFVRRKK
jgi:transposase-like protein